MNYSIVMPVFNRADLTKQCLATLRPTLEGAGSGEVIVIDNGSDAATTDVLAGFPWVRVIRNERNLGFAAACNQGVEIAAGRFVIHLNNDTIAQPGWLARMLARFTERDVGIVGARLLFPNDTIQHAGVLFAPHSLSPEGFGPLHFQWGVAGGLPSVMQSLDLQAVTGACLATPRDLYRELGGFDEVFWNGYEDVDYCLKVRARGLRVVYEPSAVLYHLESQSGVQRKRRVMHNIRELSTRWAQHLAPDHNRFADLRQRVRRGQYRHRRLSYFDAPLPATTVIVHGPRPAPDLCERLRAGRIVPDRLLWAGEAPAPPGLTLGGDVMRAAQRETEGRADRYVAFIDSRAELEPQWLSELVDTIEYGTDVVAATVVPPAAENEWPPLSADAGCTLVKMGAIPQHVRLGSDCSTLAGNVADWLVRCVELGRSIRRTHRATARVPDAPDDERFVDRHGRGIAAAVRPDPLRLEALSRRGPALRTLTSIVMLSWNAPEFTELAVESIQRVTAQPYEIIIVDNGSGDDTIARLRRLSDVRIVYNAKNMGFAHGCNQGMAAARGTHIVLLNNDVVVTEGWLDALLDAHRNGGTTGITAPRSNYVAGHQQCGDANYGDLTQMHEYAAERRTRLRGRTYHTDRVIGFCMCITRAVIDEVGGIDPRYGIGNFEDDDYCLRVRAAGYDIVVCEDSFIHHFGNVTFKANNIDWGSQMQLNWNVFAERWDLPRAYPANGYNARPAILRGFRRERDFVALPVVAADADPTAGVEHAARPRQYALAILASVRDENDWSRVAPVVGNYARALTPAQSVVFAIAAVGELDAVTLGARVERALSKIGIDPSASADIDVSDVMDTPAWRARFAGARCLALSDSLRGDDVEPLAARSPSGLKRIVEALAAS